MTNSQEFKRNLKVCEFRSLCLRYCELDVVREER